MIEAPPRSREQRMTALNRANVIRTTRADWKKAVKRRQTDPLTVLLDPPAEFETMKVFDLLIAAPKVGRVKANRILMLVRVSPSKTLGGLSQRQRAELAAMVGWRNRSSSAPGGNVVR